MIVSRFFSLSLLNQVWGVIYTKNATILHIQFVSFEKCVRWRKPHYSPAIVIFITPKVLACPSGAAGLPPTTPRQPQNCSLSLDTRFPVSRISYKCSDTLRILFIWILCSASSATLLDVPIARCFSCWRAPHRADTLPFVWPLCVRGHWDCFLFGATTNEAAI